MKTGDGADLVPPPLVSGGEAAAAGSGRRRYGGWGGAGLALLGAGLWALVADVPGLNATWYIPAWYGYLLFVDALIFRLQGHSFVSHRRRELAAMLFWSVPFWFVFELYNLRLENWYYVFGLRSLHWRVVFSFLAFATVFPACFFHAELARALGIGRRTRWPPLAVDRRMEAVLAAAGVVAILAPLVWPRFTFPLVWAAPVLLPDLACYRLRAPSLLADLERGRPGRMLQLLAGGLAAGVAWEGMNYWARTKWIYTVPGFESAKLFEMPLAGFGGFPLLALGAFSTYSLLSHFLRGGRSWQRGDDQPASSVPPRRRVGAMVVAVAFSLAALAAAQEESVRGLRPVLAELEGIDADAARALRRAGVPSPERLADAARRGELGELAERTGIDRPRLERAARHATLALHKGMGSEKARLLATAGIGDVAALAGADPVALTPRLRRLARRDGAQAPEEAEVRVWVRAADVDGTPRR